MGGKGEGRQGGGGRGTGADAKEEEGARGGGGEGSSDEKQEGKEEESERRGVARASHSSVCRLFVRPFSRKHFQAIGIAWQTQPAVQVQPLAPHFH